jgi:cellulose synthase/poly-beta-1,6-N-acetylglucosamine synthase-like glycosyltransferase
MLSALNFCGWILFVPLVIFFGLIVLDELIVLAGVFFCRPRLPREGANESETPQSRYAFLLAAHNEEAVLPYLLNSLVNQDYPSELYDIYVLADHCSDNTAAVARAAGATVFERDEVEVPGKGFAVQHLLDILKDRMKDHDATITLDADAIVVPHYLTEMNRIHQAGYPVVMGCPFTPEDDASLSWINRFGLQCVAVSETARFAMGFAARLSSNTTLIHKDVWEAFEWKCLRHLNTAEETCGWLIERGIPIGYASDARLQEEAARDLEEFAGQRSRWYITYCRQLWHYGPRLLWSAIRNRDWWRFEALVGDFFVIGHTVELLYGMLLVLISLLTGSPIAIAIASCLMLLKMFQVLTMCFLTGASLRELFQLAIRMPYHAFSWLLAMAKSTKLSATWVHSTKTGHGRSRGNDGSI